MTRPRLLLPALLLAAFFAACVWGPAAASAAERAPLRVAVTLNNPPYHYEQAEGGLGGFDVDVVRAIGRELRRKVVFVTLPSRQIESALDEGRVDIAIGAVDRPAQHKKYALSRPYLFQRVRLFVHEKTTIVNAMAELTRLKIGVREGVPAGDYLKLIQPSNRRTEPSAESGLKKLMSGELDVFIGDEHESHYVIQKLQLREISTVGDPLHLRRRVFVVRSDHKGLADQIDQALDDLQQRYRLQEIQDRWLAYRVSWVGANRTSLVIFLVVIALMASVLLGSVLWNQRLSEAVADRTREVELEHEHFQNIFDHASDGIVVIDPETLRPAEANRTFLDLMQYGADDLKLVKLSDLDAAGDQGFAEHIRRASVSGENVLFEVRMINRAREPIDFFIHARVLPYRGKQMVVAIARDITHRKKLEAMKDTILQDVAHELKTPMAKLMVSMELLEQKLPPETRAAAQKQLDVCHRSVARLHHTVEGILHLSRLESHTVHLEMGEVALNEVVEQVMNELKEFADRKDVALRLTAPPERISVRGDREMLRRLFVNLVQNAIKFTEKGSVTVSLQTDGEFVRVGVVDTGIGLDQDDLTRIFSRFFQKSAAIEGSGIGLTIAQKIVAFHNGVIWAESEGPGKGAQMYVLLPQ